MPEWIPWPEWLASVNLFQVAIVVVALYVIARLLIRFWPWLKKVIALVDALGRLPAFIERTDTTIERLRAQVENDHKTNLRDEVTELVETTRRLEDGVSGLYIKVEELSSTDESIAVKLDRDNRRLEDLERTAPRDNLPKEKS